MKNMPSYNNFSHNFAYFANFCGKECFSQGAKKNSGPVIRTWK